ncbi:MAG: CDP-6-deoxy-delta-3,4-glucoseen reductase [Gammaproteobacteria bacterium]|nr:MAG: CDP-6-deoxy-delta-3,4-glucoseen reductase [Gammaproteobacteria bacterium]
MSFKVTIEPSGHQFACEADETILDAALRQGWVLPYGCRNGACGACMGEIVSGEVDYAGANRSALSAEDEAAGKALFCQARPLGDLVIRAREIERPAELQVKRLPARVERMTRLADDVMELGLKIPESERLAFLPGQYIDILLRDGSARAFSLANPPHRDELLELHIRHVPGGKFTDHVFNEMKPGALLRIEGPRGSFHLDEQGTLPVIMVAGGTGFAPMQAMLEHAIEDGDPRAFHLFWGARDRSGLYRDDLARSWAEAHDNIHYYPVLSEPAGEDAWTGEQGLVHEAVLRHFPDLSGFDVYVAGPPAMVDAAKRHFLEHGLPEERLHFDSFEFSAAKQGA